MDYIWVNNDGKEVHMKDIPDKYLRNIVNFIARGQWSKKVTLDDFYLMMFDALLRGIDISGIDINGVKQKIENYQSQDTYGYGYDQYNAWRYYSNPND